VGRDKDLKRGEEKQRKSQGRRILGRGKVKNQEVFLYLHREAGVAPRKPKQKNINFISWIMGGTVSW